MLEPVTIRTYLRDLTTPRLVLWCYLIWWLFTVVTYFDPSPRLWLTSVGISAMIGTGLYLSTAHAAQHKTVLDRWQVFRFFLMPFCVSSFAALIKDRGFILVFHPTLAANMQAIGLCIGFCVVGRIAKASAQRVAPT